LKPGKTRKEVCLLVGSIPGNGYVGIHQWRTECEWEAKDRYDEIWKQLDLDCVDLVFGEEKDGCCCGDRVSQGGHKSVVAAVGL
jgi:hypothetical protein